ncbi:alpha/beta hydrolase [Ideonella sp.]|uniref:alpha/beta fold hydrolase n=1 Tax=Ideonella sp. TaxID=1929293 RepID=UPI002B46C633|nr:alpha/beta hydrolase [Ideonella sp.]HJV71041.1 alpha/beta hydrolase [Ideonella sp.]
MPSRPLFFPDFTVHRIPTDDDVQIHALSGGEGPPLLVLHGHPQTHVIWHRVAARLAERFSVVLADLRGYGDSSKPAGTPDHATYSKRTMARDMLRVMQSLGHERFAVLAHDRGARVSHRLAADHPQAVSRLTLLDIAPTLAMYEQTTEGFARAYWHWFFLIQRAPLPERLLEADPGAYVRELMGARDAGLAPFDERALAEYTRCLSQPGAAHALCEDYRAAATIDLEHDRADRAAGRHLSMPLQVLWGVRGIVQRCFDPLAEWRRVADDVRGQALSCGHYIPEEAPEALLDACLPFLTEAGQ